MDTQCKRVLLRRNDVFRFLSMLRIFSALRKAPSRPPHHADWTFQQVVDYGRFHHRMPYEFDCWTMTNHKTLSGIQQFLDFISDFAGKNKKPFTTISHEAARKGWLPENFKEWRLCDGEGLTVAHALVEGIAAGVSRLPQALPDDFWTLGGQEKALFPLPVAHHAIECGYPCEHFTSEVWAIRDASGQTAAHRAALIGRLPEDFSEWGFRDARMNTVAHIAAIRGDLPARFDDWTYLDEGGEGGEGDEEGGVRTGWVMRNERGDTVAHIAAKKNILPVTFGRHGLWGMTDQRNQTVIEVAQRRGHVQLIELHRLDVCRDQAACS